MALWKKDKKEEPPSLTVAPDLTPADSSGVQLVKGHVSLSKGAGAVRLEKSALITATCTWPSGKDFDIVCQALVKEGDHIAQVDVATYGCMRGGPKALMRYQAPDGGWIEHAGDIKSEGGTEIVRVSFSPSILAVAFFAYSAKVNGIGSFQRYKVDVAVDNGKGTVVTVKANDHDPKKEPHHPANNDNVYTFVPATITNSPEGPILDAVEMYSERNSENRPKLDWRHGKVHVKMDAYYENEDKR